MRTWTLAEANAALPRVRQMVSDGRSALAAIDEADAHLQDLGIVWGKKITDPACPDHEEFVMFQRKREEAVDEMMTVTLRLQALGCEVKDFQQGLVDFQGHLGSDTVNLCWRWGEPDIRHWHTLDSGFAGRKPIPGL